MEILTQPLRELTWYGEAMRSLQKKDSPLLISGTVDSQKLHMIRALNEEQEISLIVTYSENRARDICEEYLFYDRETYFFPAKDLIFYQSDVNGKQLERDRMRVLSRILEGGKITVVTTLDALMEYCLPLDTLKKSVITLEVNSDENLPELTKHLIDLGYENVSQVEAPGQFSLRGGILDIFDLTMMNPVRIEFWGDTVTEIRLFDVESQRSIEKMDSIRIFPGTEIILTQEERYAGFHKIQQESLVEVKRLRDELKTEAANRLHLAMMELETAIMGQNRYLNLESYIRYFYDAPDILLHLFKERGACIFFEEADRVILHAREVEKEFKNSMEHRLEQGYLLKGQTELLWDLEEIWKELKAFKSVQLSAEDDTKGIFGNEKCYKVKVATIPSYHGGFQMLVEELAKYKQQGYRILVLSTSTSKAKRLADEMLNEDLVATFVEDADRPIHPGEVVTFYGRIRKGFVYPELKFMVVTEEDIFGSRKKDKRKHAKFTGGTKIKNYGELHVGDYVIHEDYGIGIYRGIVTLVVNEASKDYLSLEYRNNGTLYIPPTSLDRLKFYADKDVEKKPKIHTLGGKEWIHTREKVEESIGEVVEELVELYSVRNLRNGYRYKPDTPWQREFEEAFPYEETEDQLHAINATKSDMESSKIMDRLVCGDVGFGKTEVAIRAAFKAVQDGKQVAYLVPTTILAEQHFHTFRERMKNYPVTVEMLSRFRTNAEIKKTLTELKQGHVDIVIGTHRLLSKDVVFKDLGLLIIDEEQRFGVAHKEKIKQLKENVDVLTLTATPIPRTLHMSMVGIRDMSLLDEAPQDRRPIQTYVMKYDEEMVREAIHRELSRSGQVYYVFNRIHGIEMIANRISRLVPQARVTFAHGQMEERELEDIMATFIRGEIDVLISTTIIETGLDIPNVNTIIIHSAEQMGLAQLYQLRGRVGRSNRTAYAFLMYDPSKILSDVAEKRLTAIRDYTELGSGYKIAMRDLEIRGAGTLLGKKQHGHMQAVGYDLYCKMLEDALREKKGEPVVTENRNVNIELKVSAYIPPEYIVNEKQKLEIYQRIADIHTDQDIQDMTDELRDRFGTIPREAENLLKIASLKRLAQRLCLTDVKGMPGLIRLYMDMSAPVNTDRIPVLLNKYEGKLRFRPMKTPLFYMDYELVGLVDEDEELLLENTRKMMEALICLFEDET